MNLRKNKNNSFFSEKRILVLAAVMTIMGLFIIGRLFFLQILKHDHYTQLASKRQEISESVSATRGSISVKEKDGYYPLVANREYYLLFAEPYKISSPGEVIDKITPILGLEEDEWQDILPRLSKKSDPYEPLWHKVTKEQSEKIKALEIDGLGFSSESYRFYTEKSLGGHILGFSKVIDNELKGQYGIEGYFDKELSGRPGIIKSFKDALGSLIAIGPRLVEEPENGSDIVLTINREIQYNACRMLKGYYEKFKAESGTVIIMEPTGAIIAMCNFPDFDPENYKDVEDINVFNNPAIFTAYEPGSVFKAFTMAAGIDSGAVKPEDKYDDKGEIKISSFTIRNSDLKAHGSVSMTDILKLSLNTGAIYVEQKVGKDKFKKYVENLGFGKDTGITLDKEMPGDISSLNKSGEIYGMTASFGQGIMATPIQLVTAFAALANQGKLPRPYIVSEIRKPDGEIQTFEPQTVRQVISPSTASTLSGMLTSVVEQGYGKKAGVSGYFFAGKTGTAQIASPSGGYGAQTNHTFIGYGPVSKPKFVMLVKLAKPQGPKFAEDSITPLFHDLAEFMINYYKISPDY